MSFSYRIYLYTQLGNRLKKQQKKKFSILIRQRDFICLGAFFWSVSCFRPEANMRTSSQSNVQDSDQNIEANQVEVDNCSESQPALLRLTAACRPKDEGEGVPGFLTENFKAITVTTTDSATIISGIANSVVAADSGEVAAVNLVFIEASKANLDAALAIGSIKPEVSGVIVGTTHPKLDGSFSIELARSTAEVLAFRAGGRNDDHTISVPTNLTPGRYHGVFKVNGLDTFAPIVAEKASLPQNSSDTYWIFASREVHDGKFTNANQTSGLAGMDHFCQEIGPSSIQGTAVTTWKAIAGDYNTSALSHLDLPARPFSIKLVDGSLVTSAGETFFSHMPILTRSISLDQFGNEVQAPIVAWTGISYIPNARGQACLDWTDNANSVLGEVGNVKALNNGWLANGPVSCQMPRRVYCLGH